jgi:opacity protein-like surface antigen
MQNRTCLIWMMAVGLVAAFGFPAASVAQYGYVPTPMVPGAMAGDGTLASMAPPMETPQPPARHGTFVQIEGSSLSVRGLGDEAEKVLSALNAETTYGFTGTLGHLWQCGLGLEFSVGYYSLDFDSSVKDLYGKVDADVSAKLTLVPVFINARYSLRLAQRLSAEVGAGVGGVYASAEGRADTSIGDFEASRDAFAFGFQGFGGLAFILGSHADLTLQYRYMVISSVENLTAHSIGLGLRLRL